MTVFKNSSMFPLWNRGLVFEKSQQWLCGTAPVTPALKNTHCRRGREEWLQHASNSGPLQHVGNGYAAPIKALEAIIKLDGKRLLRCY